MKTESDGSQERDFQNPQVAQKGEKAENQTVECWGVVVALWPLTMLVGSYWLEQLHIPSTVAQVVSLCASPFCTYILVCWIQNSEAKARAKAKRGKMRK